MSRPLAGSISIMFDRGKPFRTYLGLPMEICSDQSQPIDTAGREVDTHSVYPVIGAGAPHTARRPTRSVSIPERKCLMDKDRNAKVDKRRYPS